VDEFEGRDSVTLNPPQGGGTDFRPVFDWVAREGETPDGLIYLTDMYGCFPSAPGYPVLWASCTKDWSPDGVPGTIVEID